MPTVVAKIRECKKQVKQEDDMPSTKASSQGNVSEQQRKTSLKRNSVSREEQEQERQADADSEETEDPLLRCSSLLYGEGEKGQRRDDCKNRQ